MLEKLIREKIKTAMREKNEVAKNVLRVAVGEVDVFDGKDVAEVVKSIREGN